MAKKMGFSYFQGFFFSRPELVNKKRLSPLHINQIKLIRHAMDPLVNYKQLGAIIRNDAVLTLRILKLANSAYYGLKQEIKNVNHALAILGIKT